ncbi:hypothetical protein GYMLUDRAFT_134156, partial [Collybiopsis luxurians FD-317 M1]
LSGCILNEEVAKADGAMRQEVQGRHGTGQCDRWKNNAKDSLITNTLNVELTPYLLNVTNISTLPKIAETLFNIILNLKEIELICEAFKVLLVAWCTD